MVRLKRIGSRRNVASMTRFGINTKRALGVSVDNLRRLAREIGKDHALAQRLWKSGIHEARMLAAFVDEPERITSRQLERWVNDLDSWDICDQASGVFDRTRLGRQKIPKWAKSDRGFVKRAAFAMIAGHAVHDKAADDGEFERYLEIIKRGATDDRNFVKKAVSWGLRSIGKRNRSLNRRAIAVAKEIGSIDSKAARWIAADALRELTSTQVQRGLSSRAAKRQIQRRKW